MKLIAFSVVALVLGGFSLYLFAPRPSPEEIIMRERVRQERIEAEHRRNIERMEVVAKIEAAKSDEVKKSENYSEAVVGSAGIIGGTYLLGKLLNDL